MESIIIDLTQEEKNACDLIRNMSDKDFEEYSKKLSPTELALAKGLRQL